MREDFSVNIDLKTLEALVAYAKDKGISKHKTISVHFIDCEVGDAIYASATWEGERTDLTSYDAW